MQQSAAQDLSTDKLIILSKDSREMLHAALLILKQLNDQQQNTSGNI